MNTDLQTNITSTSALLQLYQSSHEYKCKVNTLVKYFNNADINGKNQIIQEIPSLMTYLDLCYPNLNHTLKTNNP